jgi:type I restriction enzyme M protein
VSQGSFFKDLITVLGFKPKENSAGIFEKGYPLAGGYAITADAGGQRVDYGDKIRIGRDTCLILDEHHRENGVTLECVDRLLEKGYRPENIVLEKTYPSGHGTSGRLDICVTRDDGSEYMLIECKTLGGEFKKALTRMRKDGGQLFTYFKFSNKPDIIMLYASKISGRDIVYRNEIVKIEDDYRTGDALDFYEKWNKLNKDSGVFDPWVKPYSFQSRALTKERLKEIRTEDSSFIFNRFLEILRHNVVSDKGNAFNKIFTLFLCKVYDETSAVDGEELQFQWKEGVDNYVDFQLRLTGLYGKGMQKFLERAVSDFNEDEFHKRSENINEETKKYLLREINKLRLEKNNEFAIKEVYDAHSFEENAKVVKEVVELIQGYKIRYNKRQQYLSDFFELLLTTGLKQEAGQFFTPVPIARFIIKSLPIDAIVFDKLRQKDGEILPYMIDYAAGSGHFITEYMHEVQRLIDRCEPKNYIDSTGKKVKNWQDDNFDWATRYVYGVEKDYRLVKVGKVGCYLHGDGLANVILSDGLAAFRGCGDYKDKLKKDAGDTSKDNRQFDILLSNPPYSVSAFRQTTRNYYTENDFELYESLTDSSSEIECLFVERAKQLLKDDGVAGIILPKSILEKGGIYTKTREIILRYFKLIAIAEFGSNTFMATGTSTVVLFLRRRNDYESRNFAASLDNSLNTCRDNTINGIERPIAEYVSHVWGSVSFNDYMTLLEKKPNENIENHEIYKEYKKKLKIKTENDFWDALIDVEKEKLFYFILAYNQKIVLVKTGEKEEEKRFLGYKFSDRREMQGIFPIQTGRTVEECTQLFDSETFENTQKASSYIYQAFKGNIDLTVSENLKNNVFYCDLARLFTFNNAIFEKELSLTFKERVEFKTKLNKKRLGDIFAKIESGKRPKGGVAQYRSGIPSLGGEHIGNNGKMNYAKMKFVPEEYFQSARQGFLEDLDILLCKDGALTGKVALFKKADFQYPDGMINEHIFALKADNEVTQKYVFYALYSEQGQKILKANVTGAAQGGLNRNNLENIQIPFPLMDIQKRIVAEIEALEEKAKTIVISDVDEEIEKILSKYLL